MRHKKPTELENSGRIIRKAAQILADRGWVQGNIGSTDQGMCAVGAIRFSILGPDAFKLSVVFDRNKTANVALAELHFRNWLIKNFNRDNNVARFNIPAWNDFLVTSGDEVVRWMNKFADEVDPQK